MVPIWRIRQDFPFHAPVWAGETIFVFGKVFPTIIRYLFYREFRHFHARLHNPAYRPSQKNYTKLIDRFGMREKPAVVYPAFDVGSVLARADMEFSSPLRQSLQTAGLRLPAGLSASNGVGVSQGAMMADQSLRKAGSVIDIPVKYDNRRASHASYDLKQPLLIIRDGLKAHRSGFVCDYLDTLKGHIQIAFLPPYAPDRNPVEYLWAWLKRYAMANYGSNDLAELHVTARSKLNSAQRRPSIIAACWKRAALW